MMAKPSTSEFFDSSNCADEDPTVRPILLNDFSIPTPIVNMISEYGLAIIETWSRKRWIAEELKEQLHHMEFIEFSPQIMHLGIFNPDQRSMEKLIHLQLNDVRFIKPRIEEKKLRLSVQIDESQLNTMKLLLNVVVERLEAFHKDKFPFLTFTDNVERNKALILSRHRRFMGNSTLVLTIQYNMDTGFPNMTISEHGQEESLYFHSHQSTKKGTVIMRRDFPTIKSVVDLILSKDHGNIILEIIGVSIVNGAWYLNHRVSDVELCS